MDFLKKIEEFSGSKPNHDALIFFDGREYKRYSFKKIWDDICEIAKTIEKGTILIIVANSNYDSFIQYLGCLAGNGVPAFYSPLTTRQDPEIYKIEFEKISNFYNGKSLEKKIGQDSISTGFIQFSSGTTGLRKGVFIGGEKLTVQLESLGRALNITSSDKVISWLPVYHDMGLITSLFMPLYFGIPVVHIEPVLWSFKPSLLHNAIEAEKGTIVWQPNFAFKHLLIADQKQKFNYYLGTLRKIISCSEPCRKSVFEEYLMRFSEDGLRENALQTSYALAENVFAATLSDFQSKADWLSSNGYISSGSSLDHTEIIISEENESEETEDSEIYVSGSCVVDGYVELSSDNFSRTQKGVNRFKTRDKGILVNNSLIVFGRIDDTLIINGKKIYAHELEREIGEISSIKPGRVLATISNSMTNINIYYEGSLEEVDELILRKIIKSKFEVSVENFAQLPPGFLIKTSSGKIARKKSLDKINQS